MLQRDGEAHAVVFEMTERREVLSFHHELSYFLSSREGCSTKCL